ncbi:MAG: pyruvate kinase [Alphaproteobacteria bacterium]
MPIETKTNILATLGPATETKEMIEKLLNAGADAFRVNFSHGDYKTHKQRINLIRKIEKERNIKIGILADLQGPKLRVGDMADNTILVEGREFVLDMKSEIGNAQRAQLPHKEIFKALKVGDDLLLNDGNLSLRVVETNNKDYAKTVVKVGGKLTSKKGVNLPNTKLDINAITPKDEADLEFALKCGVDYVGLSFVQHSDDVRYARKLINGKAWIISKLEKPSALEELSEIVALSDGIMVARGDLGVECPVYSVPVLQKRIVAECRKQGRPVIVATQMLESMIEAPTPTRAEVSDIATAVYSGVDTVMLSAETAAGKYPVQAVSMMKKIIKSVESDSHCRDSWDSSKTKPKNISQSDSITYAATKISEVLTNVKAIVTFTSSGSTTLLAARERPCLPVIAITPNDEVARKMSLVWGVNSYINRHLYKSLEKAQSVAIKTIVDNGYAKSGDHIIITFGFPLNQVGLTNMLHTVQIP